MMNGVELGAAAEAELSGYLAHEGFTGPQPDRPGAARFDNGLVELRITLTDPQETLGHGIESTLGRRLDDGSVDLVGVWRLVPDGTPARSYSFWEYGDQDGLRALLARFRDLVLRPYVAEYWRDLQMLDGVLEHSRRERSAQFERDRAERHLSAARNHYAARRFADAVREFVLAGRLDRADSAKLDIARRWLAK